MARPAVCPLISSDKVNVSDAGISPVIMLDAPFWDMSRTLPLFPESTVATFPTMSVGTRTSIASSGSKIVVPAVSRAPIQARLDAGPSWDSPLCAVSS